MNDTNVNIIKNRYRRRILVRTVVLAVWAASLLVITFRGGQELPGGSYLYMVVAIAVMWVVTTVRDVRRLRDESALRKAAIAETDERNVLITYKATRLAVVIVLCLFPIAMCVLAYNGKQDIIDALGFTVCTFLIVYLGSWYYVSRKC